MLKAYFIKNYGVPTWTAGVGGSGGAIQQYLIAQLYPGLLDGIQPGISFPETLMPAVWECRLLNRVYALDPATWTTGKQNAVNGSILSAPVCLSWLARRPASVSPRSKNAAVQRARRRRSARAISMWCDAQNRPRQPGKNRPAPRQLFFDDPPLRLVYDCVPRLPSSAINVDLPPLEHPEMTTNRFTLLLQCPTARE